MKVAISGYYGCGNAGDEAVLAGIKEAFHKRASDSVQLTALSQNPAETEILHQLPSIYRMNFKEVKATIKESQLLISGGGSLLQDSTSFKSLLYYLGVVKLAQNMRVPVMFYAQGMGPLRRSLSQALVKMVANRVQAISVRDEASATLLKKIGVVRPPIEVTADPAFGLPLAPKSVSLKLWEREGLSLDSRSKIGIALRPMGATEPFLIAKYAKLLMELEAQSGAQVILIPMQIPGDVRLAQEIAQKTGRTDDFPVLSRALPPIDLLNLMSHLDAVVAMRLHALIFAARVGASPFALSYDPKVDNLMELLHLEDQKTHWRDFDPTEVANRVSWTLTEKTVVSHKLKEKALELKQKAYKNADIALELMRWKQK